MYWHVSRFGLKEILYPEKEIETPSEILVNRRLHTSEIRSFGTLYLNCQNKVIKISVVCGHVKIIRYTWWNKNIIVPHNTTMVAKWVPVGVLVSQGLQNNRKNLKTLAREMRLETCDIQTVFNITMLKLKIKQEKNIQNNTKWKKRDRRIGISAFCIYLHVSLVLCMTQHLV
jgi:hypothetical protein